MMIGVSAKTYGQNHYWSQQYGARATLTGGNCMSCANENSVFLYNPGAMGFQDSANISISSNIYGLDLVNLKNAAGPGIDLTSNKLAINAQVMVGSLNFKKVPRLKLVYGYLLRNYSRMEFETNHEMYYDVITGSPGMEYYRGKLEFDYYNYEYWGGIAAGYYINEYVSVGLGHYGGYIGTRTRIYQDATADGLDPDGEPYTAGTNVRLNYKLDHFYILWKPGIDLHFGNWKIGIAGMVPSTKVWGEGRISQSVEVFNLDVHNTDSSNVFGLFPSMVVSADQKKVEATMKLAPSISLGVEYQKKRFRIALSAEYFFPLKEYNMVKGSDDVYIRPTALFGQIPVEGFTTVSTATYGVLNAGIGAEIPVSEKLTILCGFHTDFNNKIPLFRSDYKDYISEVSPNSWHLLNTSLGVSLTKGNKISFFGLTYNYGFSTYSKAITNFAEPTDQNLLVGQNANNMEVSIHQLGVVIGYTHFLGARKKVFQ
jgi:hypothetical protein